MTRDSEIEGCEQLAIRASWGDLSMLQAAAKDGSLILTTTAESSNDRLWSAMTAVSWTVKVEAPVLPQGMPVRMKSFRMLPEASTAVLDLVERITAGRLPPKSA
jgi:hypothetical protein